MRITSFFSDIFLQFFRSQALGLLNVLSRLGAASAPWVAQYLGYSNKYLPFIVMGSLSLVSAGLCFKLRETNGMAMAETLEDFYSSEGKNINL